MSLSSKSVRNDTIIILLSTFNGSDYIKFQLDSLINQTCIPDYVVICDDCSTDDTVSIVEEFIKVNGLDGKWFLSVNSTNKGWRLNFNSMLSTISSGFVFLCDQDDIWRKDKIQLMIDALNTSDEILLLSSDKVEFYNDEENYTIKLSTGEGGVSKWKSCFLNDIQRPGCTYLIRGDFIKSVYTHVTDPALNAHDALLWSAACSASGLYNLSKNTIDWRRHIQSATLNNNKFKSISENILDHIRTVSRLEISISFCNNIEMLSYNKELLSFYRFRLRAIQKRSFFYFFFKSIFNLHKFKGKKDFLNDLYSIVFKK